MKFRFIIISVCLCAVALIITVRLSFKSRLFCDDKYQRKFVIDAGFLSHDDNTGVAVCNYVQAIQNLRNDGVNESLWDGETITVENIPLSRVNFDKVAELLVEGAKSKELGIAPPERSAVAISLQDYGKVKFSDFILLPKVVAQVVKEDLKQKKNLDRALLLGKANIAMGVQFSTYDYNKLVHLVGLVCKREGLKILETYVKASGDQNLLQSINDMRTEFEKECENVKK